ncbi:hypothetical protein WICPIJ_006355 [Wickerhamomyces pijperi]|uniref:Increased recombination centers protein 22 n=1 Tax=Wickerhamomyces pijperi TaxID=599730 RepID=A0A9P8Q3Z6_WICPI|nr:hypothetical protein WICPIJ_006355 [Wickerhamomyces pijperi]
MKFSSLLVLAGSLLAPALGQAVPRQIDLSNPGDYANGQYVDQDQLSNQMRYLIDYNIIDFPKDQPVSLYNGDEITVNYTFANHEDYEISVVGVGGQFLDPYTGEAKANITDARLGPLAIAPGAEINFQQRIGINLAPNNYVMVPGLYILRDTSLALIGTKTTLAIVTDRPISLFNPQLLVLELLFLAFIGAAGYFGYEYFTKASTAAPKLSKKQAKLNASASAAKSTGTVNSEWLPDNLKKTKQRKA